MSKFIRILAANTIFDLKYIFVKGSLLMVELYLNFYLLQVSLVFSRSYTQPKIEKKNNTAEELRKLWAFPEKSKNLVRDCYTSKFCDSISSTSTCAKLQPGVETSNSICASYMINLYEFRITFRIITYFFQVIWQNKPFSKFIIAKFAKCKDAFIWVKYHYFQNSFHFATWSYVQSIT